MRLIDADALLRHLAEVVYWKSPQGYERVNDRNVRQARCEGLKMAKQFVMDAPTIIPEPDLDETEQKILRKFRELREKGRKNRNIHSPTAWALYWTWKDLELWSNVLDVKGGQHE